MFGVVDSTASKVVFNFVQSIIYCGHHHLTWPNSKGLENVKAKFEAKHGMP